MNKTSRCVGIRRSTTRTVLTTATQLSCITSQSTPREIQPWIAESGRSADDVTIPRHDPAGSNLGPRFEAGGKSTCSYAGPSKARELPSVVPKVLLPGVLSLAPRGQHYLGTGWKAPLPCHASSEVSIRQSNPRA